eukprot:7224487-Lingulodinium_polyedra.AAC.1
MPRLSPAQRVLDTGQMGWNSVSRAAPATRASTARGSAPEGTARDGHPPGPWAGTGPEHSRDLAPPHAARAAVK